MTGARSGLFPSVDASAGANRARTGTAPTRSTYTVGVSAQWEIDLWGRIRRNLEASERNGSRERR